MAASLHEIRDPVHAFVRLDDCEREVLNSRPFQRLRHIHQLALTYLVYPGATHKRFEHSLGVMELAGRAFDTVTDPANLAGGIRELLEPLCRPEELAYWRRVLRMAALCHDIGHLPFSHSAERALLPAGWDHERLTREIIAGAELGAIWERAGPPLRHEDIARLAVGPGKASDLPFTDWETILSQIIVGEAFGMDRMDYLLRDSHHAGAAYGGFDHHRLIDTLRILPAPPAARGGPAGPPALGVEEGGLQSSAALMLARYFMYTQVYFHPVQRIYDIHLTEFLREWLEDGMFPTDIERHLGLTDNEVSAALFSAAHDEGAPGHVHARRVFRREHFKLIYGRNPDGSELTPEAGRLVFEALCARFGAEHFRHDRYRQHDAAADFPVRLRDGRVVSSLARSDVLNHIPVAATDYVYADRALFAEASAWLDGRRAEIVRARS